MKCAQGMRISDCGLQNGEFGTGEREKGRGKKGCGFQIADRGLQNRERIAESEPRITDHEVGVPDHAGTHWPSKAISSQSIGVHRVGIGIASNEAGRANQLRNADWGLRIGNWENGNCQMFGDVFSGAPEGSTGELRTTNREPRITTHRFGGLAGWA